VSNDGPLGQPRGIGFGIIIFIITIGIYGLYWSFKTFDELEQHTMKGIGGGIALIIAIIFGPAIPFLAGSEVGNMYAADGQEKPVTGLTGLWILLPIVGGIVWFVKTQGALNRYWESKGAIAA
jgi:Domain of unknown function (DUF4234)